MSLSQAKPAARAPAFPFSMGWLEEACVFFGLLFLLLSQVLGAIAVLGCIGSMAVLLLTRPRATTVSVVAWSFLFMTPFLAIASAVWSPVPGHTLRIAVQVLLTMTMAVVLTGRVTAERFIYLAYLALILVGVGSALVQPRGMMGDQPLVGLTGSKNQMGFVAHLFFAFGLAVFLSRAQPRLLRLATLVFVPLALVEVVRSNSAGALVSVGIGGVVFGACLVFRVMAVPLRIVSILACLVLAVPLAVAAPQIREAATRFQTEVLHKDPTLTGRTYLWERAGYLVAERPVLGAGYASFWRQGSLEAEGMWAIAQIPGRAGFNFHNAFVDMAVELGYLGVATMVLTIVITGGLALGATIFNPSIASALFMGLLAAIFARTTTETNLIGAWNVYTVLMLAAGMYGWWSIKDVMTRARQTIPS